MIKRFTLSFLSSMLMLAIFLSPAFGQYANTWESLDARPVPAWFGNGKFGIFIHWGVYSVPGYCGKGNYAEWYQNGLMNGDTARVKFHQAKFGQRSYYDLANDFKAELFKPDEWARLFEQSGAKYIVLTSKHHDGFCLWPDKTANATWGFNWNAADIGPKRDLLGDLFTAVRKTSVRAGMYYSLYEWYNPLWKSNPAEYATRHAWPQMKTLINTYQPDVFWTDGDWDASAETWKSREFLAWLYNESPVKDKVVTYDRWGSGIRFRHGNVYTPEYQPDLDFDNHAWEESRGMGYSYGYNREEDAWDYNSTQSLVLQLVDKVSRGGNFLLDIGPDEHGKIPPIMQERLLQIGDWLNINGTAIYNTVRWKTPSQWSEGRRDYKSKSGDMLLKITLDPDPGYAVKEVFYTYNPQRNALYAILPKYPSSHKFLLKNISLPAGTALRFLSTNGKLSWLQQGGDVEVTLPDYDPNAIKAPYAYVVEIADYGRFAAPVKINAAYPNDGLAPRVSMTAGPDEQIHYTLDGTEPTMASALYSLPFDLDKSCTVKAKSFATGALPGQTQTKTLRHFNWMPAISPKNKKTGLSYQYFEPAGKINLEVIDQLLPVKTGVATEMSEQLKLRSEKFALSFEGLINIEKSGKYEFFTSSDDGSKLYIDGIETVNNDGEHGAIEQNGMAALLKGLHKIKLVYFDGGGGNELKVLWQPPAGKKAPIPAALLFHE